ncbi:MAG: hypothetical protein ACRDG8_06105 [Actinomycetota bacterium]
MSTSNEREDEGRCPVCGEGTLADIDFGGDDLFQDPESRQVDVFTCGHEVARAPLDAADTDRLDVERRSSEETAAPTPDEEGPLTGPATG